MTDVVRILNEAGTTQYGAWLDLVRGGSKLPPPGFLLNDTKTSEILDPAVTIESQPHGHPFVSRYEFGTYLKERFSSHPRTAISRNAGLWNWLSLYYMDQLAPAAADGTRQLYELEGYLLDAQFNFRKYYRHAVRSAWLAALEHGHNSQVLLIPAGKTPPGAGVLIHRGEIFEQLASRQWVFGSRTIIEAAAQMYLDSATGRPKRGTAGSVGGSPRRLATVIQQLELTYDLRDCPPKQFLSLLPREFEKWKPRLGESVASTSAPAPAEVTAHGAV